jgi:hypothetical protein
LVSVRIITRIVDSDGYISIFYKLHDKRQMLHVVIHKFSVHMCLGCRIHHECINISKTTIKLLDATLLKDPHVPLDIDDRRAI